MDLPIDVLSLIYSYADPETTWVVDKVSKLPVNTNGWIIGDNKEKQRFSKKSYLDILEAMQIIPTFIKPSTRYDVGSYGGKHAIEKSMKERYINNGLFICAMILLGYEYKKPINLNVSFKAKYIRHHT
jgi:hypothetical protein